ncbi:chromatin organization modifier domain-containing protein [Hirsutella rhossiliensis]|uniref:Chromo (CHRromatin organization MOdifier) domain-containing protein n=1 Tax=Hirsutella rhossiliensis TaxID=111463 RepID=A0A9P8MM88_9HYPO|nr:chromo (CHRromatin organization MOdifier) domain-containing protein [Hirsutella rhossiliensis]KAH0957902.1 chromo (CHRromatin organization MOdifier) domain-containing protein [Hirsutella rhossiliensis]
MAPPSPGKTSVFLGRETLMDRDEVDKIRHSIELEADALAAATLRDWDGSSSDGEAIGSPAIEGAELEQQGSGRGSSNPQEPASPAPKRPRGRPRGRPRRTETPRVKGETRGRRRSSRIRSVAAPPASSPATPKLRPRETKKKAPAAAAATAGKEWEIERIVDSRIEAETLKHFYLVKWRGFDAKHNTWESKKNLDGCSDAIVAYERSMRTGS